MVKSGSFTVPFNSIRGGVTMLFPVDVMKVSSLVLLVVLPTIFLLEARRMGNAYFSVIACIGVLYPLGKFLQVWMIGPGWIRWYMGDVGWVSCMGILIASAFSTGSWLYRLKRGIDIAYAIAFGVELAQLLVPMAATQTGFKFAGDWVDMGIFFFTYAVNYLLIFKMIPKAVAPDANLTTKSGVVKNNKNRRRKVGRC